MVRERVLFQFYRRHRDPQDVLRLRDAGRHGHRLPARPVRRRGVRRAAVVPRRAAAAQAVGVSSSSQSCSAPCGCASSAWCQRALDPAGLRPLERDVLRRHRPPLDRQGPLPQRRRARQRPRRVYRFDGGTGVPYNAYLRLPVGRPHRRPAAAPAARGRGARAARGRQLPRRRDARALRRFTLVNANINQSRWCDSSSNGWTRRRVPLGVGAHAAYCRAGSGASRQPRRRRLPHHDRLLLRAAGGVGDPPLRRRRRGGAVGVLQAAVECVRLGEHRSSGACSGCASTSAARCATSPTSRRSSVDPLLAADRDGREADRGEPDGDQRDLRLLRLHDAQPRTVPQQALSTLGRRRSSSSTSTSSSSS